jgi:hypothetical protein
MPYPHTTYDMTTTYTDNGIEKSSTTTTHYNSYSTSSTRTAIEYHNGDRTVTYTDCDTTEYGTTTCSTRTSEAESYQANFYNNYDDFYYY